MIEWAIPQQVHAADLEGVAENIEDDVLTYWLDRARRAILATVPALTLEDRIESGAMEADSPADVQIDLVLSKLGNPGGIRTIQETNGPTSGSVTYGGDTPGQLSLTVQHRRMLGVPVRGVRAAGTVLTWG